jgi:4-hydroxy-2-oxoheptanedioate aldolase
MSGALRAGRPALGAWCNLADPFVVAIMAAAGFEWLCLDLQHGIFDDRAMVEVLRAPPSGTAVLVRVPSNSAPSIGRALDAGAAGVIVPMVGNAAEAAAAVAASRYAPQGSRSWGPLAGIAGGPTKAAAEANAATICAVMVETPGAVEQVEAIAAVPGVDAVFLGPFDLALAYGTTVSELLADTSDASPLRRVVAACQAAGIIAGAYAGTLDAAVALRAFGFTMLAVTSDSGLLVEGAGRLRRQAAAALGPDPA